MKLKTAFLIFEGVAELDFVAPKDVFYASRHLGNSEDEVYTVAASMEPLTCFAGLRVLPDYTFASAPAPDILFVPGTADPMPMVQNEPLLQWVRDTSAASRWTAGVCSGAAILLASAVARGKRITTHWAAIDQLRQMGGRKWWTASVMWLTAIW